jgi:hypothetical protein
MFRLKSKPSSGVISILYTITPDDGLDLSERKIVVLIHLVDKANAIADCLENQFTPQDL